MLPSVGARAAAPRKSLHFGASDSAESAARGIVQNRVYVGRLQGRTVQAVIVRLSGLQPPVQAKWIRTSGIHGVIEAHIVPYCTRQLLEEAAWGTPALARLGPGDACKRRRHRKLQR